MIAYHFESIAAGLAQRMPENFSLQKGIALIGFQFYESKSGACDGLESCVKGTAKTAGLYKRPEYLPVKVIPWVISRFPNNEILLLCCCPANSHKKSLGQVVTCTALGIIDSHKVLAPVK